MQQQAQPIESWWVWVVAGVVNILFGLLALFWPGLTLYVLVLLFGFYALVFGIVQIVGMFRAIGAHETWWTRLLVGVASIVAGAYVLASPGISTLSLLLAIAIWAVVIGVVEVVSGLSQANFLTVVLGVITILFGFLLLANPLVGALAFIWAIGAFAIVRGIVEIVAAFRVPSNTGAPS